MFSFVCLGLSKSTPVHLSEDEASNFVGNGKFVNALKDGWIISSEETLHPDTSVLGI